MDSSVISVKLDAFDGPLDLLLHERFFGDGGNAVKDKVQNASSGRGDRGG